MQYLMFVRPGVSVKPDFRCGSVLSLFLVSCGNIGLISNLFHGELTIVYDEIDGVTIHIRDVNDIFRI